MKAYVVYYGEEPAPGEETPTEREARLARPSIIQFLGEPLLAFPDKRLADIELQIVRRRGYFVGSHLCEFAIDELANGQFAIFCIDHPPPGSNI